MKYARSNGEVIEYQFSDNLCNIIPIEEIFKGALQSFKNASGIGADVLTQKLLTEMKKKNGKIQAIKLYRQETQCSLHDAKDYIEVLAEKHNIKFSSDYQG